MAEDKQLTVAELLARSSKERERRGASEQGTDGTEAPRRRRRRSLDEGGISVAELTGSIKRVQSEPARSRHAETTTSAASAASATRKTSQPSASSTPAKSAPAKSAATSAKPASAAKPTPEVKAEPEKKADTPSTDDTTVISKVEADAQKSEAKPSASKSATADSATAKSAAAKRTGAKSAGAKSADAKPADAKPADAKPADAKPADAKPTGSAAAKSSASQAPAAKADETTVMPVQSPQATASSAKPAAAAGSAQAGDAATGEIPVVATGSQADSAELAERDYDDSEAEEDGKLSAVSIVVLALVGIILGAIVFKGFEVLWGRFDRILVSILALVVSGAMVGVVHALRTARDSVSMTLAGVVGLVLTFGPLLIIIL